jgi:hypothetical protein
MDLIEQKLVVREWPLKKPGDEKFFGYLVAVGVFPSGWVSEHIFPYVDFAYGDDYIRYRLPYDEGLWTQLLKHLDDNLGILEMCGSIEVKLWVKLTKEGYEVDLP